MQGLQQLLMDSFFAPSEKMKCENSTETSNSRLSHNTSVTGQNVQSAVNLAFSVFKNCAFQPKYCPFKLRFLCILLS